MSAVTTRRTTKRVISSAVPTLKGEGTVEILVCVCLKCFKVTQHKILECTRVSNIVHLMQTSGVQPLETVSIQSLGMIVHLAFTMSAPTCSSLCECTIHVQDLYTPLLVCIYVDYT